MIAFSNALSLRQTRFEANATHGIAFFKRECKTRQLNVIMTRVLPQRTANATNGMMMMRFSNANAQTRQLNAIMTRVLPQRVLKYDNSTC